MFSKLRLVILNHFKKNINSYFFLFIAFIIGVSAGAFTVNGLSAMQRDEIANYFQGFLQLLDNQKVDSNELFRISMLENMKIIIALWVLGVSIIGIPFVFVIVGIRGFITGFSSGFIIQAIGLKGVLFTLLTLLPKEIIIIPSIIALGVSGINFSLSIIKNKPKKQKSINKESLKSSFTAYCFTTLIYSGIIACGALIDAYITPIFIRMILSIIS